MLQNTIRFVAVNRRTIRLVATLALLALSLVSVALGCPEIQVGQ
jgi:hypothetical protein